MNHGAVYRHTRIGSFICSLKGIGRDEKKAVDICYTRLHR